MKNTVKVLGVIMLTAVSALAQNKKEEKMEKQIINSWQWQNERSYVQAVEVTKAEGTLYVSGQTAIDANGVSSTADMKSQLIQSIQNLEKVIHDAGYKLENIVRLNIYTTSSDELFACFDIFQGWVAEHHIEQASTLLEVNHLFETLKVELEATVVK